MAGTAELRIELDAAMAAEIDRLRAALRRIADHHDQQLRARDKVGDDNNRRYHEERRNLALMWLTPNAKLTGLAPGKDDQ